MRRVTLFGILWFLTVGKNVLFATWARGLCCSFFRFTIWNSTQFCAWCIRGTFHQLGGIKVETAWPGLATYFISDRLGTSLRR